MDQNDLASWRDFPVVCPVVYNMVMILQQLTGLLQSCGLSVERHDLPGMPDRFRQDEGIATFARSQVNGQIAGAENLADQLLAPCNDAGQGRHRKRVTRGERIE
jgi:hypothetical protein